MTMPKAKPQSVSDHFTGRAPSVKTTYTAILKAARKLGPVTEEPKQTSIHLVRTTAFAGVATRKEALILTLKSASDLTSKRIGKHERASAKRWHLEIRLESPREVDAELRGWLASSYALSGPRDA
jgi:Domain of unknown function (DUF5655)